MICDFRSHWEFWNRFSMDKGDYAFLLAHKIEFWDWLGNLALHSGFQSCSWQKLPFGEPWPLSEFCCCCCYAANKNPDPGILPLSRLPLDASEDHAVCPVFGGDLLCLWALFPAVVYLSCQLPFLVHLLHYPITFDLQNNSKQKSFLISWLSQWNVKRSLGHFSVWGLRSCIGYMSSEPAWMGQL